MAVGPSPGPGAAVVERITVALERSTTRSFLDFWYMLFQRFPSDAKKVTVTMETAMTATSVPVPVWATQTRRAMATARMAAMVYFKGE